MGARRRSSATRWRTRKSGSTCRSTTSSGRASASARPNSTATYKPSRRRPGPLLASKPFGTLYLGMTSDLARRVWEHKNKVVPGFTTRYGVDRLVWFESYDDREAALRREKQIKGWRRDWKINLIERQNRYWIDLYDNLSDA